MNFALPCTLFCKRSIDTGECPSLWKYADITPVYKKGDASQASNYRPISILPATCRLFERILSDGINYFLYENRLIYDGQYGFVKGRSTEVEEEEEEEEEEERLFGKINVHYA